MASVTGNKINDKFRKENIFNFFTFDGEKLRYKSVLIFQIHTFTVISGRSNKDDKTQIDHKKAEITAQIKTQLPCQHSLNEDSFRSVSASRTRTHINDRADCFA
jgi:hypothetical protein